MKKEIAKRMEKVIADTGLNTNQFAASIGVSQPTVARWLWGHTYPSITVVIAVSKTYKVSMDWLLLGEGKMYKNGI